MTKKLLSLLILIPLTCCTLTEPASILIENKSDYPVTASVGRQSIKLEKSKGGFLLVPPGETTLTCTIEEIGFTCDYPVRTHYLEKKKIVFKM